MNQDARQSEYKVLLDVFEGPLDLLLYLIRRDELDIYDIPIERITRQYMEYMDLMRMLDLNIAGEFLVMAATLMMIKSRMLLPVEDRGEAEEEDEEDPRWDLVRQLVAYKKFKDAALHLHECEVLRENAFSREAEGGIRYDKDTGVVLEDVSIFDLMTAFHEALRRAENESLREIFAENFTVGEKLDFIMDTLRSRKSVNISDFFRGMRSRQEIVCTFLAMLELMRLNQVCARQDGVFGDILIEARFAVEEEGKGSDA